MNILFLGDVVAKSGLLSVTHNLKKLKKETEADFVIVNAENAANGKGITHAIYQSLIKAGADVITLGNHAFAKKEILEDIDLCPYMARPYNIVPRGVGTSIVTRICKGRKIAVVSLMGSTFMPTAVQEPVPAMREILPQIDADIVIVDLHAEATSDKILFFYYFRHDLTAVIGTHTHVQTADERVLDGCAFISDVGMCGPYNSVLGRDIGEVSACMIEKKPTRFIPATGPAVLCGCVIRTDDETDRAVSIERIQIRPASQSL